MIKRKIKQTIKKVLLICKRIVVRVPILRKIGIKARDILFPEMAQRDREIYHYQDYYPTIPEHMHQVREATKFKVRPLISLVLPTYNTPEIYLRECLDSVLFQSYDNWELCIADDASPDKNVRTVIEEYAKNDSRIKWVVRKKNGHISEASNSALEIATGDFTALLDHDDILWPNALYEMVKVINADPKVDLIYTDEDKIEETGKIHSYPFLKPDWSPEFLESCNYITHFTCIRTSILRDIGGFRKGCEGAQDWDLFIRITEKTSKIVHIPKLLYSWRIHETSTAANTDAKPYVYEAQKKLLDDHLERTKRKGVVETGIITQHRTIKYEPKKDDSLTVIVSCADTVLAKNAVRSISQVEPGIDIKLICVRPGGFSDQLKAEFSNLAPELLNDHSYVEVSDTESIYEVATRLAKSDFVCFVDSNAEIISENWARIMVGDAQLPGVGVVGPVLLSQDRHIIQSAGLGINFGDNGYLDMLQGTPFHDPHYTRGLYAKSRRNVSAVNGALYGIKLDRLKLLLKKTDGNIHNSLDLCLAALNNSHRNIYTPYIQAVLTKDSPRLHTVFTIERDIYLNPNFKASNQRMEVKG